MGTGGGGMSALAGAPAGRVVAERKWRLGVHARGHPSSLMAELLRALQVRRVREVGRALRGWRFGGAGLRLG